MELIRYKKIVYLLVFYDEGFSFANLVKKHKGAITGMVVISYMLLLAGRDYANITSHCA